MTAETMQTYALLRFAVARSNGSSFLFTTQYEMPFINKSEATKDRKVNVFQFRWTRVTGRGRIPGLRACVIGGENWKREGRSGEFNTTASSFLLSLSFEHRPCRLPYTQKGCPKYFLGCAILKDTGIPSHVL